jgi:hypothetical protein
MSGKYMGYSGFPPGVSLGKNLTEPLSQQTSNTNTSSFNPVDYYKSLEGLPESTRNSLLLQEVNNRSSNKIGEDDTLLKIFNKVTDPARQKETLDQQLAYDKARMKEAFPYLMAREIPRQISEGFGNQAAMTILGARSAVDAMNQTLASYPQMSFAMTPFRAEKYLS